MDADKPQNLPAAVPAHVKQRWEDAVPKGKRSAVITVLIKKYLGMELGKKDSEIAATFGVN